MSPRAAQGFQPIGDGFGHVPLIGDVAGQNDVPALVPADEIFSRGYRHAIGLRVQAHCGARESIDVAGFDPRRAALAAAIATRPEPEAKSSTLLPATNAGWSRI